MDAPQLNGLNRLHQLPTLTLILPALNEAESIGQSIREADEALSRLTSEYEILVVDDGCTDDTAMIVKQEALCRSSVRLLSQPGNLGYGAALARGFREARMDLVSFSDADCQFDLNELDRLMFLARDYDIVCGYRIDRQDPWIRKVYSRVYNTIVQTLLGTGVRDIDCAMKVFRREVIQNISIETKGFFVNSEVLTKARLQDRSIVEVGVTHRTRAAGESTVSAMHTIPVLGAILRFWWNMILFPQRSLSTKVIAEGYHELDASITKPAVGVLRFGTLGRLVQNQWFALILLAIIGCGLLFPNISYPLIEPDESRYVQIAMEMVQTGDYVTPTLNGDPYLDKPPLLYWLTAMSMSMFGMNEWAARLPTVVASLLTVILTFAVGKRVVGSTAAWCGSLALLLCGGFVLAGRFVIMDSLLTCCTTACFLCSYLAIASGRFQWRWWIAASIACGLGMLCKGPVAMVLCLPPLVAFRWISAEKPQLRVGHLAVMMGIVSLMAAPWFVAVSQANPEFINYFFLKHNFSRFAGGFNHVQPFWFYVPVMMAAMFPASLLVPVLGVYVFGRGEAYRAHRTQDLGFLVLSSMWIVGFFSLSSCKLATYILPAFPLVSLLLGSMIQHCVIRPTMQSRIATYLESFPRRASATMIAVGGIVAMVILQLQVEIPWTSMAAVLGWITAAVVLAVLWKREVTSSLIGWGGTAAVSATVVGLVFSGLVPEIARSRSILLDAVTASGHDQSVPVVYFGQESYGAELLVPSQHLVEIDDGDVDALTAHLKQHPSSVVVTSDGSFPQLASVVSSASVIIPAGGRDHVHLIVPRHPVHTAMTPKAIEVR